MIKIKPLNNIVQLKIQEAKAGVLDTSSKKSAVEFGEVVNFGENVKGFKKGDKVFFKAWATDIISHEGETYYFINIETNAILALVG